MAARFSKLNDLYWAAFDRNFNRLIVGGALIGAVVGGACITDEYKPRIRDTASLAMCGAVAGGITGAMGPVVLPIVLPVVAFIGPMHLYKKYRWEKSVKNLK
jgi:hypothetical protein